MRRIEAVLPMLPMSDAVWREAATCAQQARAKGVTAPATDVLIFACARHHGAGLLHSDSDFDHLRQAVA